MTGCALAEAGDIRANRNNGAAGVQMRPGSRRAVRTPAADMAARLPLLLAAAAAALCAVAKADPEKVKEAMEKCKASENLESLDGLKTNKAPSTEEEKCFIGCMMMDMKLLSADGQFDAAGARETINGCQHLRDRPEERAAALEVADDCAGRVSGCSGHCECGPKVVGCLVKGMLDRGFEESFARMDKILQKVDG